MRTRGLQRCQLCDEYIQQIATITVIQNANLRALDSHAPQLRARRLIFFVLHRVQAWMYDDSLAGITARLVIKLGVS